MRRLAPVLAIALVVATACSGDGGDGGDRPDATERVPPPDDVADVEEIDVTLTLTEVTRLVEPTAFAVRAGTPGFYVAEKGGLVVHISPGSPDAEAVLDISDEVSTGSEQGLLGLAFSPDGARMYLSYTNLDGDTRVDERAVDSGEKRSVFGIDQPYPNHNGGNIVFGPDRLLWLGLGDGGSGGDPEGRAQDPNELLGKIIRFDPADPRPEVYALGLRNPWRFTFDRANGDLWIGDVGQHAWEEIDHLPASAPPGADFGWNLLEGTHPFAADEAPGAIAPVFEYGHDEGQSVVGGYVYRGSKIPDLGGVYIFADTYAAELRLLRLGEGSVEQHATGIDVPGGIVSSFGEDADGELYVLSLDGGVYRLDPGA